MDYKNLFSVQNKLEKQLKIACPNIDNKSGLYFLIRIDNEENKKYCYIGKGVNLIRRMCSHLQGYQQRIDISLKKRGFHSQDNPSGWKLNVLNFPKDLLDEKERLYIDKYKNAGYILYNIESGGTTGKTIINERKPAKGYYDGITQGEKNTLKKVKEYFDKYLDFSIKDKPNKIKERKLEEFKQFLQGKQDSGN